VIENEHLINVHTYHCHLLTTMMINTIEYNMYLLQYDTWSYSILFFFFDEHCRTNETILYHQSFSLSCLTLINRRQHRLIDKLTFVGKIVCFWFTRASIDFYLFSSEISSIACEDEFSIDMWISVDLCGRQYMRRTTCIESCQTLNSIIEWIHTWILIYSQWLLFHRLLVAFICH
jgi:hypothetical protein